MKKLHRLLALATLLILSALLQCPPSIQAHPTLQGGAVVLQTELTGPDESGRYRVSGTVAFPPLAAQNPDQGLATEATVSVQAQFIGPEGAFSAPLVQTFDEAVADLPPGSQPPVDEQGRPIEGQCDPSTGRICTVNIGSLLEGMFGNCTCSAMLDLTSEDMPGVIVWQDTLSPSPSGQTFTFDALLEPPPGATQVRFVALQDCLACQATASEVVALTGEQLPEGHPISITAGKTGYNPATQVVGNSENLGAVAVSGVVRDPQSGAPVAGAAVLTSHGGNQISTVTDENGAYMLVVSVPGGEGEGNVTGLDFALERVATFAISVGADTTTMLADGSSTTAVTVRVTDPVGAPVEGRAVDLSLNGELGPGSLSAVGGTTNADGVLHVVYTAFRPAADPSETRDETPVTIVATDRESGESSSVELILNQLWVTVLGPRYVVASSHDTFPAKLTIAVTDRDLNPVAGVPLWVRLAGDAGEKGGLAADPNGRGEAELHVQTGTDGTAEITYRWQGDPDVKEIAQDVIVTEEATNATVAHELQVHGLDLAISKVEEAGFTGVTGQQAFLKIYFKDRIHPDLDLARFESDSANWINLGVTIRQFASEGSGAGAPFESITGAWETDAGGTYVSMPSTPHLPYVIPINDGTTWYEIRVDPVDRDGVPLPDRFRGNNGTIIALETGSPDGWLHLWLKDGILTPHNYFGVAIKCVARFLPGLGDAITAIDTLNQVYNSDVLGLGQSTAQVLTENLQEQVAKKSPGLLTKMKASALNNVVSCMQDAYGVYKTNNAQGAVPDAPRCGACARWLGLIDITSYTGEADDYDRATLQHHIDQFVHGLMMDTPNQRAVVVTGLDPGKVTLADAQGQAVTDDSLINTEGNVFVAILPVDSDYVLNIATDQACDINAYASGADGARHTTYHHALAPNDAITGKMPLGPGSDFSLAIDTNGDARTDQTLQAALVAHDVTRPTISALHPAEGATVGHTAAIEATYADSAGGSGLDTSAVHLLIDGQDVTNDAGLDATSLTYALDSLPRGIHTLRLEVCDYEGNRTVEERQFAIRASLLGYVTNPLVLGVLGGGGLLAVTLAVIVGVLIVRRKRSRPSVTAPRAMTQDGQGRWWQQDVRTGRWLMWDGRGWRVTQARVQSRRSGSWVMKLAVVVLCAVLLAGLGLVAVIVLELVG